MVAVSFTALSHRPHKWMFLNVWRGLKRKSGINPPHRIFTASFRWPELLSCKKKTRH